MNKRIILKHRLFSEGTQLHVTAGATILKVAYQDSQPFVWIEHAADLPALDLITIESAVTGSPFDATDFTYIDTLLSTEHGMVYHFYWKYGE